MITAYWNRKNKNTEKVFGFLRSKSIFWKEIEGNSINLNTYTCGNFHREIYLDNLTKGDLVFFFTHGAPEEIIAFLPRQNNPYEKMISLVNGENSAQFKEKKLIAFSCNTAKNLGMHMCDPNNPNRCTFYIGFKTPINIKPEAGTRNIGMIRHYIYTAYSSIFSNCILYALKNNITASLFADILRKELRKYLFQRAYIKNGKDLTGQSSMVILLNNMLLETSDGLTVCGDVNCRML